MEMERGRGRERVGLTVNWYSSTGAWNEFAVQDAIGRDHGVRRLRTLSLKEKRWTAPLVMKEVCTFLSALSPPTPFFG